MQFETSEESCRLSRRNLMKAGAVSLAALGVGAPSTALAAQVGRIVKNGRINQSVCRWCYGNLSLEELCAAAAKMGLK